MDGSDLCAIEERCNLFQFAVHLLDEGVCFRLFAIKSYRTIVEMKRITTVWRPIGKILDSLCPVCQVRIYLQA